MIAISEAKIRNQVFLACIDGSKYDRSKMGSEIETG